MGKSEIEHLFQLLGYF